MALSSFRVLPTRQALFCPYTVVTKYEHTTYCVLHFRRVLLILTLIYGQICFRWKQSPSR